MSWIASTTCLWAIEVLPPSAPPDQLSPNTELSRSTGLLSLKPSWLVANIFLICASTSGGRPR